MIDDGKNVCHDDGKEFCYKKTLIEREGIQTFKRINNALCYIINKLKFLAVPYDVMDWDYLSINSFKERVTFETFKSILKYKDIKHPKTQNSVVDAILERGSNNSVERKQFKSCSGTKTGLACDIGTGSGRYKDTDFYTLVCHRFVHKEDKKFNKVKYWIIPVNNIPKQQKISLFDQHCKTKAHMVLHRKYSRGATTWGWTHHYYMGKIDVPKDILDIMSKRMDL